MSELVKLTIRPGINKETTQYGAEGSWYDADKVRFRYGFPEKIGGWEHVNGKGDSTTFTGIARALINWPANDGTPYTALGTDKKLQLWQGGAFYDITPIVASVVGASANIHLTSADSFTLVSLTGHSFQKDDFVLFYTSPASAGGIDLTREIEIVSVVDANSFYTSLAVPSSITSVVPVSLNYDRLLSPGRRDSAMGFGWGAATYSHSGGWGSPAPTGTQITLRHWSLDNWGEDLVACPRAQALYQWVEASGTDVRAIRVSGAPDQIDHIIVSPEDRHLIAFGTQEFGTSTYDPTLIRWCSQEDLNDWNPVATNTAGGKKLSGSQKIVATLRTRAQILIWTENALYSMRHVGEPVIFAFDVIGTGFGIASPNAAVEAGGRVFWMDREHFVVYDGASPRQLPCTVLRYIFDNIDTTQYDKVFAGVNSAFSEVIWLYQSLSSTTGDVDRYAIYNYVEDHWTVGSISRTTWVDSGIYEKPVATGVDSKLFYHELGSDADGGSLSTLLESSEFDIGDGTKMMFTDRIIPDYSSRDGTPLAGNLTFTLTGRRYPNSSELITKGPYVVSAGTQFIEYRLRARQMSFKVESSGTESSWRLGAVRLRIAPDGER